VREISEYKRLEEINIVLYIVLCIVTFGLFYLVWQYKQMHQVNVLLGRKGHSFAIWLILSLITFGVYHLYHEYVLSKDLLALREKFEMKPLSSDFPLLCLLVSIFGFFLISDFIHQDEINKIIRHLHSGDVNLTDLMIRQGSN